MPKGVHKLNNGREMPAIGFGTWRLRQGSEAEGSVKAALRTGYRLVDTAKIYGNEQSVGKAIRQSGINRQEIFVTTKLWPSDFSDARQAFNDSLERLGLGYVDLYLIHWPNGGGRYQAWQALEEIYNEGQAKAIGVSNFMAEHLTELFEKSTLVPAVNQIEFHPFIYQEQKPVLELCQRKGIAVEAYSPLAQGHETENKVIADIATAHGKSSAQIMLRWALQKGTVPLPRSSNPAHIRENYDIVDFELSEKEMIHIDDLSSGDRQSWDPTDLP